MVEQALGVSPGEASVFRYERRPDPFEQLGLGLMKGPSIEERIRSAGTPVLEYQPGDAASRVQHVTRDKSWGLFKVGILGWATVRIGNRSR